MQCAKTGKKSEPPLVGEIKHPFAETGMSQNTRQLLQIKTCQLSGEPLQDGKKIYLNFSQFFR